jgi:hypothetical protein
MSSDDALDRRARLRGNLAADRAALLGEADAFVVVSWWQEKSGDGTRGDYAYEPRPTLNDALDTYREYQDGEYARARAIGIFPARNGLPVGRLEAGLMLRLMHETRRGGA